MGDMVFPGGLRPDGLPAALSAPERLAAVRATGLLDTGPEGPFDDLARLPHYSEAMEAGGAPDAVVALRLWARSRSRSCNTDVGEWDDFTSARCHCRSGQHP